mgnify:CR=1 FL=1
MLVGSTTLSFAQTNNNSKSTSAKVDVEVVLNKQVEILNARIDSMNIAHEEAIEMVKYMMDKRNVKIKELIVEEAHHTVKEIGSAIAAVIYITDDILE